MNLDNKIAIVTGVTGGLGSAIARALIQNGAIVYGLGRNVDKITALKQQLGANFQGQTIDITDENALKKWVQKTFSSTHSPSILINNAGVGSFNKIDETSIANWKAMIDTNLNGLFYITSLVVPFMKKDISSSHIVNIGSILWKVGRDESSGYCTSKFGVQGFSQALRMELRSFNIKVTCFNPGSIETDFFASSGIQSHSNMLQPKDLSKTLIQILQTPDNLLIDEITIRPLNPKKQ
ncbi:MAG: SDR family oxidoreductase [Bacteroidia bacterium]|nr:MAG: SDR family oxidoreductase [Bacteroidia bacterium]